MGTTMNKEVFDGFTNWSPRPLYNTSGPIPSAYLGHLYSFTPPYPNIFSMALCSPLALYISHALYTY